MDDLVVILRTQSDIEASVIRGLLETHGIRALLSSDVPHSVLPLSVSALGEVRITVRADEAEAARQIIASHRAPDQDGRVIPMGDDDDAMERRLGHRFEDRRLLDQALTHRSRAHEDASGTQADNESMEFLGDAIIGFVVADRLFRAFPDFDEGQKSKVKARLVSAPVLADLGERLGLGEALRLGRGEEKTGGRKKQALLADSFEAVVAALYLDGGLDVVRRFLLRELSELVDEIREGGLETLARDHKSALQERLQGADRPLPSYRVIGERGPDHRKIFEVEVSVEGRVLARGEGRSKKDAEQQAAEAALAGHVDDKDHEGRR